MCVYFRVLLAAKPLIVWSERKPFAFIVNDNLFYVPQAENVIA
jgi:hypothetical protein